MTDITTFEIQTLEIQRQQLDQEKTRTLVGIAELVTLIVAFVTGMLAWLQSAETNSSNLEAAVVEQEAAITAALIAEGNTEGLLRKLQIVAVTHPSLIDADELAQLQQALSSKP